MIRSNTGLSSTTLFELQMSVVTPLTHTAILKIHSKYVIAIIDDGLREQLHSLHDAKYPNIQIMSECQRSNRGCPVLMKRSLDF